MMARTCPASLSAISRLEQEGSELAEVVLTQTLRHHISDFAIIHQSGRTRPTGSSSAERKPGTSQALSGHYPGTIRADW
jgi:hypothetical protein